MSTHFSPLLTERLDGQHLLPVAVRDRPVPLDVPKNLPAVISNLDAPIVAAGSVEVTDDLSATLPIVPHIRARRCVLLAVGHDASARCRWTGQQHKHQGCEGQKSGHV